MTDKCEWKISSQSGWSVCSQNVPLYLIRALIREIKFKYCPYCGKEIEEVKA